MVGAVPAEPFRMVVEEGKIRELLTEALSHPHAVARSAFVTIEGLDQPAPAPRFERTPLPVPASPGQDEDGGLRAVLRRWQDG